MLCISIIWKYLHNIRTNYFGRVIGRYKFGLFGTSVKHGMNLKSKRSELIHYHDKDNNWPDANHLLFHLQ